jgi:hypothetical protein
MRLLVRRRSEPPDQSDHRYDLIRVAFRPRTVDIFAKNALIGEPKEPRRGRYGNRYSDGPKPGMLEALVFGFQGKPIDKQSRLTLSAPRPGTRRLDQRSAFVVGTSSRP